MSSLPPSDPGAWFLLAASNSDTFVDSKKSDLLIYTDNSNQRLFVGSISNAALVVSTSNVSCITPLNIQQNVIMNSNGIFMSSNTSLNIGNFSINSSGIGGTGLITGQNIQNATITTTNLSNASVTTPIVADAAITTNKIAIDGVRSNNILNGSITSDKLDRTGNFFINNVQVSPVNSGQPVFIGFSNSNIGTNFAIAQTSNNETFINSGYSNPLHFSIGGMEVMTLNSRGDLDITGLVTQTSDRNLKWDITPITNGLAKLLQLNGYTYKMRGHSESAGLIAQEVQTVLPQAVKTSPANKSLTLDYAAMSGLYVEAFKDLARVIQSLQSRIEELEKKRI